MDENTRPESPHGNGGNGNVHKLWHVQYLMSLKDVVTKELEKCKLSLLLREKQRLVRENKDLKSRVDNLSKENEELKIKCIENRDILEDLIKAQEDDENNEPSEEFQLKKRKWEETISSFDREVEQETLRELPPKKKVDKVTLTSLFKEEEPVYTEEQCEVYIKKIVHKFNKSLANSRTASEQTEEDTSADGDLFGFVNSLAAPNTEDF